MIKKLTIFIKNKAKSLKIFDWILIVCGLITIAIFAILFFRKSTYITITIAVGEESVVYGSWYEDGYDASGPKDWFADSFHKGQQEKDGLGRVQAEILNVYSYNKTATHKAVYLNVKLNTIYNRGTNTFTYKGTSVLVGSTIKLNLDKVYVQGIVTKVQDFPNHSIKQGIVVEAQIKEENSTYLGTSGVNSYIADAIEKGDTIKDGDGVDVIKILDKRVVPAEVTATTDGGKVVKGEDPTKKDVFLTLEIQATKIDNKYYFLDNIPILIDQPIPINTSTLTVFPVVTKFLTY